jgi:thiamine monophosphate synthase
MDDAIEDPEKTEEPPVDWEDLRAQAAKLGITLSQLQQQQREKKLRLARKEKVKASGRQDSASN